MLKKKKVLDGAGHVKIKGAQDIPGFDHPVFFHPGSELRSV
jgi:hypothetical protein